MYNVVKEIEMSILVTSNNGRIHLTERRTKLNPSSKENRSEVAKQKKPKEYPGFVRRLCDGQWISDKKQTNGEVTCPVCSKL